MQTIALESNQYQAVSIEPGQLNIQGIEKLHICRPLQQRKSINEAFGEQLPSNVLEWVKTIQNATDAFALNSQVREKRDLDDNQSLNSISSTISKASQLKNLWKTTKKKERLDIQGEGKQGKYFLQVVKIKWMDQKIFQEERVFFSISLDDGQGLSTAPMDIYAMEKFQDGFLFNVSDQISVTCRLNSVSKSNRRSSMFGTLKRTKKANESVNSATIGSISFDIQLANMEMLTGTYYLRKHPNAPSIAEITLRMGVQVEGEPVAQPETRTKLNDKVLHEGYLTIYVSSSKIPVWKRHWFVLKGYKLLAYDFEYQLEKQLLGDIDIEQIVRARRAELDRINIPWTFQLDITNMGKVFLFADDESSFQKWLDKFEYLIKQKQG